MRTFLIDHATLRIVERSGAHTESLGIAERIDDRLVRIDTDATDWTARAGRLYCGALASARGFAFDFVSAQVLYTQSGVDTIVGVPEVRDGDRLFVYLQPDVYRIVDVH
jgi:hypothetical protein